MTQEDYLAHHGILGQKWGVRRYQNLDGSLTAEGRKRRGLSEKKSSSVKSDVNKALKTFRKARAKRQAERAVEKEAARKAAQRKASKEKAKKQISDHEKLKRHIRNKPRDFYKYRDMFTKDEAKELIEQIEWDRKIADIRFDEFKRYNARVKEVGSAIKNASDILNSGINLYNNSAIIYNALLDHQVQSGGMAADQAEKRKWAKADWKKNDDNKKGETT